MTRCGENDARRSVQEPLLLKAAAEPLARPDPRHRKQTRLEVEEWAGRASAGVAPDESDRGKQRQVGDGGGYIDSSPSALASCEVHPVGKDGWVPRVGGQLEWVIAHAPRQTYSQTSCWHWGDG